MHLCNLKTSRQLCYIIVPKNTMRPRASEVMTAYLKQCNEPPWTSYFIRVGVLLAIVSSYRIIQNFPSLQQIDVRNDQWGESHFNWTLESGANYHILRTGCYPYMKYHCTKRPYADLSIDNYFFNAMKVINFGRTTVQNERII